MKPLNRAVSIGREFTDLILYDEIHDSIVITLDAEFVDFIIGEYEHFGYKLVHQTPFRDDHFRACVFISNPK